jgi:nicotinamidase-related amidase
VPVPKADLHGNAPDSSPVALLIIDTINDLEFDGGERLLRRALPMARRIAALKKRATAAGIPAIYVNDNFGRWRSDFRRIVAHCLEDDVRGAPVAALLVPDENDYFVLKPKHSGFYNTALDLLLDYLEVRTLIITGMTTDICVLFTAADAYMRDFHIVVPRDCVASLDPALQRAALRQMRTVLKADVLASRDVDLARLARESRDGSRAPRAKGRSASAETRGAGSKRRGSRASRSSSRARSRARLPRRAGRAHPRR